MTKQLTFTVPNSWADVSLKQYLAYMKAIKPYEGAEDYEKVVLEKAINHFCNLSSEELHNLPMENYNATIDYMKDLFEEGVRLPLVRRFKVLNSEYGFIPQLDNMTYGEYLDLTTYFKDMWPNMDMIMSILYRPVVKQNGLTYDIVSYQGTNEDAVELFREKATMNIVWGAIGFFTSLQQDLVNATLISLRKQMKDLEKDSVLMEALITNGVDISQLQSLLTTTSLDLKQLQN